MENVNIFQHAAASTITGVKDTSVQWVQTVSTSQSPRCMCPSLGVSRQISPIGETTGGVAQV